MFRVINGIIKEEKEKKVFLKKINEDFNLTELKEKYKDGFNFGRATKEDMLEYSVHMFYKEKKSNIKFKNTLILSIPMSIFSIACGINSTNTFSQIVNYICGFSLFFMVAYNMGKTSEWDKRNFKFLKESYDLLTKE